MNALTSSIRSWLDRLGAQFVPTGDLPADYPQVLNLPPLANHRRPIPWITLSLLLLCTLVPRLWMSQQVDTLCADGTTYLELAKAVAAGDYRQSLLMQFNLFPFILAAIHSLGVPWEQCGEVCGIIASTLVVLPLFGWTRRQFDDRVATLACLLYAFHAGLIQWSPEMVRDPTFWLLFTTALYLMWRAAAEVSLLWYAAAGLVSGLAVLTRFEGNLLAVPVLMWSLQRGWILPAARWKLATGMLVFVLALPALLLLAKMVLLPDTAVASLIPRTPVERVETWLASWSGETQLRKPIPRTTVLEDHSVKQFEPTLLAITGRFFHYVVRGMTPVYGLLLLAGFAHWWRLFNRWEQIPPTLISLAVLAAVWIHIWYAGEASSRYVLPLVIMSTRCTAVALLWWNQTLYRWLRQLDMPALRLRVGLAIPIVAIGLIGMADAVTNDFQPRAKRAELGRWIRDHFGEHCVIAGNDDQIGLIGYYGDCQLHRIPQNLSTRDFVELLVREQPDLVVISRHRGPLIDAAALERLKSSLGLQPIDKQQAVKSHNEFLVLARTERYR